MAKKKDPIVIPQGGDDELPEISSTTPTLVPVVADRPSFIDLVVFKAKDESLATIKKKRAEYDLVKIDGVEDKEGYAKVKANMEQMRDDRRAFENAAYNNVIDPLKKALKEYADDIDSVVEEFKAGEKSERDKKDFIDNEKKRIKQEAEEAKERAALLRVNELNLLGAQFNGSVYTFEYDDGLMINVLQLKDFEQAEFDEFIEEVKVAHQVEQQRVADEKVRLEEEAETKRLADIAIAEQAEKNEQVSTELNLKRTRLRVKELKILGFTGDEGTELYTSPDIPIEVSYHRVEHDDDNVWDNLIYDLENFVPAEEPLVNYPATEPIADVQGTETVGDVETHSHTFTVDLAPEMVKEFESIAVDEGDDLKNTYQPLFDLMYEHGLTLLQGEMDEIIEMVRWMDGQDKGAVVLNFNPNDAFTDSDITVKMKMRVFPEEYREQALAGVDTIANSGSFQGLQWVIMAK